MHFMGQLVEDAAQKLRRHHAPGPRAQLGKGYLAGAVNGHKQVLLAFLGLNLGKIDVQVAQWVDLELPLWRAFARPRSAAGG